MNKFIRSLPERRYSKERVCAYTDDGNHTSLVYSALEWILVKIWMCLGRAFGANVCRWQPSIHWADASMQQCRWTLLGCHNNNYNRFWNVYEGSSLKFNGSMDQVVYECRPAAVRRLRNTLKYPTRRVPMMRKGKLNWIWAVLKFEFNPQNLFIHTQKPEPSLLKIYFNFNDSCCLSKQIR